MLLSHFTLNLYQTQRMVLLFITQLLVLTLSRMVLLTVKDIFTIFKLGALNLVLHFGSGIKLELMQISLIVNIRSSINHLHGFQMLICSHSSQRSTLSFVPIEQIFCN